MAKSLWKRYDIRKNCKALNEEEGPHNLKGVDFHGRKHGTDPGKGRLGEHDR